MKESRWYILQVAPGSEKKVSEDIKLEMSKKGLSDYLESVFIPSESHEAYRKGKKVNLERKIFPGYMLLKMVMTEEVWSTIKRINKVGNFLGSKDKPKSLLNSEVDAIFARIEEGAFLRRNALTFSVGDSVKVADGPFESLIGLVEDVDSVKERLVVSVSIWGRSTKINLAYSQVTKSS